MALERVWPKDVYVREVPNLIGKLYTQVIKATGTRVSIHVAGTLPFDKNNNLVGEGSMQLPGPPCWTRSANRWRP
jgi:hypothetical protein